MALALNIDALPGLLFGGLMTYPARGGIAKADAWLLEARSALDAAGLPPKVISSGGTPDLMHAAEGTVTTEYRPGTYIYSDRMQVAFGHGTLENCALTVKATVVSRPTDDRAVLDAGSKALAADKLPGPETLPACVRLEAYRSGGHVGFISGGSPWRPRFWLERRIVAFLSPFLSPPTRP